MESSQVQAAARKALMAAHSHYHAWPPERQERFRATMNDAARDRVAAVLLSELLGIFCIAENAGEVWRDLPITQLKYINWAKLLTTGIGEDMIWLNESMTDSVSLLDFDTLHDYDLDRHRYQERSSSQNIKGYQKRDYYALRFPRLVRLLMDKKLFYATLTSLATYITDQLQQLGDELIRHLIPHEYVEGKNHGKEEEGGVLWDIRVDANGSGPQLEELQRQWYQYVQQCWTDLSITFKGQPPAVFKVKSIEQGDLSAVFIFNNAAALERVRWRSFLSDCRLLEGASTEVEHLVSEAWRQAEDWLREAHRDVLKNFDPTVTSLNKPLKFIVAPGAFDSLLRLDKNDD